MQKRPMVQHLYSGHCMDDIGISCIEDTLKCVEEILAGSDDPVVKYYQGEAFEHHCRSVKMLYKRT